MNKLKFDLAHSAIRTKHHWSFIRVGMWASLAVLLMLIIVSAWSYRQTNLLVLQEQERTGKTITTGLASAVEENLIIRNYAQLENQLMQVMSNAQVQSALLADISGNVLSELARDAQSGKVRVVFNGQTVNSPESQPGISRVNGVLEIFQSVGSAVPIGWVVVRFSPSSDDVLLGGIHQQLLLILGLGAMIMLLIVSFGLRTTYSRVQSSQSQIQTLNDSLATVAFYDVLTRLPNRHLLADRMQQALAMSNRTECQLAVCYVDLDGFKPVNDHYGHDVGDDLLIEIGRRLSHAVRQHDTVARIGGDEFVLLISDLESFEECKTILQRLLQDLSQPIAINGHLLHVSASIGVSMSPLHGYDPQVLIRFADKAMYMAKNTGKNRWCFYVES